MSSVYNSLKPLVLPRHPTAHMTLQPPDPENKKIDITSTSIEKSIEIARDFADKLIMPAAEELGLLVRESVSFWRFKNQIRILTKAKEYCRVQ